MSKPQNHISVGFAREWRIRRPFVYRYLESEHVDSFFNEGILRISSFAAFSKHTDDQRHDTKEGRGIVTNVFRDGGQTAYTYIAMAKGADAYVLCGSTRYDESLAQAFGANSGFRINDPTSFADAVAHHLPGFKCGIEGACQYMASRSVTRAMTPINMDAVKIKDQEKGFQLGRAAQLASELAGDDLYFTKHSSYAHQHEYRMLWLVTSKADQYIEIKCPEAVQFCTKFSELKDEIELSSPPTLPD